MNTELKKYDFWIAYGVYFRYYTNLQHKQGEYDLKGHADPPLGLDLEPLVGHEVRPPDANGQLLYPFRLLLLQVLLGWQLIGVVVSRTILLARSFGVPLAPWRSRAMVAVLLLEPIVVELLEGGVRRVVARWQLDRARLLPVDEKDVDAAVTVDQGRDLDYLWGDFFVVQHCISEYDCITKYNEFRLRKHIFTLKQNAIMVHK